MTLDVPIRHGVVKVVWSGLRSGACSIYSGNRKLRFQQFNGFAAAVSATTASK